MNNSKYGIEYATYILNNIDNTKWNKLECISQEDLKVDSDYIDTSFNEILTNTEIKGTFKLSMKRHGTDTEKHLWYYHHTKNRRIKQKHNCLNLFGFKKPRKEKYKLYGEWQLY